jgi:hypothetical protein
MTSDPGQWHEAKPANEPVEAPESQPATPPEPQTDEPDEPDEPADEPAAQPNQWHE